jgi:hypothetical protein
LKGLISIAPALIKPERASFSQVPDGDRHAMARAGGNGNTATGYAALVDSYGDNNTATGLQALSCNRSGSNNTAVGYYAGGNGHTGVTTGSNNTLLGYSAGANVTTANNVIFIGSNVAGGERKQHHLDSWHLRRDAAERHYIACHSVC